jgi:hypothetical protein
MNLPKIELNRSGNHIHSCQNFSKQDPLVSTDLQSNQHKLNYSRSRGLWVSNLVCNCAAEDAYIQLLPEGKYLKKPLDELLNDNSWRKPEWGHYRKRGEVLGMDIMVRVLIQLPHLSRLSVDIIACSLNWWCPSIRLQACRISTLKLHVCQGIARTFNGRKLLGSCQAPYEIHIQCLQHSGVSK